MKAMITIILLQLFISNTGAQTDTLFQPLNIGLTTQLHSTILNETRVINIYLPDGYSANDTARYPVMYIPDGGIKEDFLHLTGIVQYSSQPWVHRFPKAIVVGIENTNRQRDFTFAVTNLDFLQKTGYRKEDIPEYGGSSKYISFLQKELQPFINARFKTNGNNTIIGESLAGLLVTEIYVKHRGLFSNYIIISPSLWWGNEKLLKEVTLNQNNSKKVNVYIGVPNKEEQPMMHNDALQLYKQVQNHAGRNTKVFFDYLPAETHATVIHQAAYNAFKWLAK